MRDCGLTTPIASERVLHADSECANVDRKALARLHSPPDVVFRPLEVPLPEAFARGEESTEAAARAAYCEAHPVAERGHDGDNASRLKLPVEDPPAAASNHWHPVPPMFSFKTPMSAENVEKMQQEQAVAMMQVRRSVAPWSRLSGRLCPYPRSQNGCIDAATCIVWQRQF